MKYEYYLLFWGEIENDDQRWIERDLGIAETSFWFESASLRDEFKTKLQTCANAHDCCIVFAEREGYDVRLRTVVHMTLKLPAGLVLKYKHDFGYGYDATAAMRMFTHNNYACDCNISILLNESGLDIPEMACGDSIIIENIFTTKEL